MRAMVICTILVAGCGGRNDPAAIDAPISDTGCTLLWRVTETGGTASIDNSALTLSTNSLADGVAVQVEQRGLEGYFTATFAVTVWTPGGAGAYVQLMLVDEVFTPPRYVFTSRLGNLGTLPGAGIRATALDRTEEYETTATAAMLRVERMFNGADSETIVTAMTADATATTSYTQHGLPAVTLALQLGTDDGALGPTSVQISELELTTDGRGTSDAFDCDSLLRE
jgi:hypothetical protein